jgi:hypothetical protein
MSAFSSVTSTLTVGQIGQLGYGNSADLLVRSYILIDATDVKPGYGVVVDTAGANSAKLPNGAGTFAGVVFNDGNLPIESSAYSSAAGGVPNMPTLRRGQVWVPISEDVDQTSAVYLQHTTNGLVKLAGTFRATADGVNTQLLANAQFASAYTAASGKALLTINLPA